MNEIVSTLIRSPSAKDEECAKITITDPSIPFTFHDIVQNGYEYIMTFYVKSDASGGVSLKDTSISTTTDWVKFKKVFVADSTDVSLYFTATGTYYLYNSQIELGNKSTEWQPAPEDTEGAINELVTVTETHATNISIMQGQISTLISKDTELEDTITSNYNSTITDIDSLRTTIGEHTTQLNTQSGDITSVTSRIATVEQNLDSYSVSLSETKTDLSDLTARVSTNETSITALQGEISLKVTQTEVDNAINSIEIGGRNLAVKTATAKSVTGTNESNQSFVPYYLSVNWNTLIGKPVTISFDYEFSEGSSKTTSTTTDVASVGMSSSPWNRWVSIPNPSKGLTGHCSGTFVIPDTMASNWGIGVRLDYFSGTLTLSNFKMETGNKETDWTPAPEDIEERVKTAEATIKLNSDNIELRVEKDGVISAINQTAESIQISASKVELSGYVTLTNLATSGTTTIDGGNITTGKISADRIDVDGIFANTVDVAGTFTSTSNDGDKVYISNGYIDLITMADDGNTYHGYIGGDSVGVWDTTGGFYAKMYIDSSIGMAQLDVMGSAYVSESLTVDNTAQFSGLVNMTNSLRVTGDIYEGGTALSSKYAYKTHTHTYEQVNGLTTKIGNGTTTATIRQSGALPSMALSIVTCVEGGTNVFHGLISTDSSGNVIRDYAYRTKADTFTALMTFNAYLKTNIVYNSGSTNGIQINDAAVRCSAGSNKSSLGNSTYLWTEVYATNGVKTTSDEREKELLSEFKMEDFSEYFMSLSPILYRWRTGNDHKIHLGLGAQTSELKLIEAGYSPEDFSMIQHDILEEPSETGLTERYSMDYHSYNMLTMMQTQKNTRDIESLKSQYLSQEERLEYISQQLQQAQAEIGQLQTQLKAQA